MKTKYVCRDLFSLYVNFHNNLVNKFTCKNLQVGRRGGGGGGGGGGKRAKKSKLN